MFIWKSQDLRSQEIARPAPLLQFVAGEFAEPIAAIWPHPHTPFLGATAARRHLVCIALSSEAQLEVITPADLLDLAMKSAIRLALAEPPAGLARALEHLGEPAWSAQDYRGLLRLLAHPKACRLFRHSQTIEVGQVRALAALPDVLLDGALAGLKLDEPTTRFIARMLACVAERDGEETAAEVAKAWSRCADVDKLVVRIQSDLEAQPAPPPFAGSERLRPLTTKAQMCEAAERFHNCLQTHHLDAAASGLSAYYEWQGPPPVVVQITRDRMFGWTLKQARMVKNKAVDEGARAALTADLQAMGVRVGPTLGDLKDALDGLTYTQPEAPPSDAQMVKQIFGDWS